MRLLPIPLLLVFLLALAAPAPAPPRAVQTAPASQQEAGQVLRDMESRLARAVASKDLDSFLSLWAEDAAVFPPGEPVGIGREKVREFWMPLLQDPEASLTWEPDRVEMSGAADLGYTYGRYRAHRKSSDGSTVVRTGKYVSIWRKEKDGLWRVVLDIGSPDPPP